ncbi:MAG: hypothetical protein B7C55_04550 [Actinomycetales bacterium mxb001]|nr:MAG: hypothetical protein B7C55_04550 [Actinomycetales bacterium mxb001]
MDLNDWEAWPDDVDIEELASRAKELRFDVFREVLMNEVISYEDGLAVAYAHLEGETDLLTEMRWLQEPLLSPDYWPELSHTGWHIDYLEAMWSIIEIASSLPDDERGNSELLEALLDDPDTWVCPVAPAAILAVSPTASESADAVLEVFARAWTGEAGSSWSFVGSRAIESDAFGIARVSPLLAVACVHPRADKELIARTAEICSRNQSNSELGAFFWDFVRACLVKDRSRMVWLPYPWWEHGFFANGLPETAPLVGGDQVRKLAQLFLFGLDNWNLPNDLGDLRTEEVAEAFAGRPELDDLLLRQFALLPYPDAKSAVRLNPQSSDETRALAAL